MLLIYVLRYIRLLECGHPTVSPAGARERSVRLIQLFGAKPNTLTVTTFIFMPTELGRPRPAPSHAFFGYPKNFLNRSSH